MKVCYVYERRIPQNESLQVGIDRKVLAQAKCFRNQGWQCDIVAPERSGYLSALLQSAPFFPDRSKWGKMENLSYDVFYVRRTLYCSAQLITFLKRLKASNETCCVLFEIPTFPYDGELSSIKYLPILMKDRWHRRKLRNMVDRVADLSGQEKIFDITTVPLTNGIDMGSVSVRKASLCNREINMICAASFQNWHAVDRLVEGLRDYYRAGGEKRIVLHLVGDGPALKEARRQVIRARLDEVVRFHGYCSRAEMDAVYDRCSIAMASLGLHRIGHSMASTLKTREYLAKGIPFVYSGEIDVFRTDPVDFCLQVPADESPVDIEKLVAFHDRLYAQEAEDAVIARIRSYAEAHVSIDAAMENVIVYLKENCSHEN